jgi:arginine metabolism regulation protein II
VKKIGWKKGGFSPKALQLHRIFAYIRVIEMTTFVQTRDQYFATLGEKAILPNEADLVQSIPSERFPHSADQDAVHETWADLGLDGPEEETFGAFYGMPASILRLMSRTNNIVAQLEPPLHHGTSQPFLQESLVEPAAVLERDICQWERPGSNPTDSLLDPAQDMRSNIATAMHHALLLYFFRFVRGTNPIILQHYVESILSNLELHHASKQCFFPGVRLGVTVWPSFIAACEALGEGLRQRAILCMRHAAWAGFQNAEAAEEVAREVWRRRDAGELHVSWNTVLRESRTILLLT